MVRSRGATEFAGPQARLIRLCSVRKNYLIGLPGALCGRTPGSAEDPGLLMPQHRLRRKLQIASDYKPLGSEQDYLAFHAAAVVADTAVGLDHTVTRDKDRNRI